MRKWLTIPYGSRLLVNCSTSLVGAATLAGCIEFENPFESPTLLDLSLPDGGSLADLLAADDAGVTPTSAEVTTLVISALPQDFPPEFLEGGGVESSCEGTDACREGLTCAQGSCQPTGDTAEGDFCLVSAECENGQCVDTVCIAPGEAALGQGCETAADCAAGLRCGVVGFSAQCVEDGTQDYEEDCETSNDCLSGLTCFALSAGDQPTCLPIPGAPAAAPTLWEGVECDPPATERVRAYFEIPGAPDAQEGDFFRLPWPNDVYASDEGRIDVTGFPTPGVNPIVGVDPVQPYVDAVSGMQGWGINGSAIFRFSGKIDFGSFDDSDAIHWVDITDPENPREAPINFRTTSGRSNYICHNVFTVRRAHGYPMRPGRTYAVWLGTEGRSSSGLEVERAENFLSMLQETAPSDPVLAAAHGKYAPFRDYLSAQQIPQSAVMTATVISVGPVQDQMLSLAEAVREEEIPRSSNWTLCGTGASPCPQAEGARACETNSAFDEYHALVELPIYQEGEAPYMEQGGAIQGGPPQRIEPVCLSLTVPRGATMPAEGWPLVVFGHGTGGSFRSGARSIAADLTSVATPDGMVNFAVLGFDQVQHGPRRGESDESPDNLFFNFLNPDAAQGNPLQGGADLISIARFAATLDLSSARTSADPIKIDPQRLVYFGHSQGAMHGSLALPLADEYRAAVFSGNGASLMHALLTKTEPVNIAQVVPLVINDGIEVDLVNQTLGGSLPGGDHHPVLTLVQRYIDPADPLAFARQVASDEPMDGFTPKHIFQTFGVGDSFSPPLTMSMYTKTADFSVVRAHGSADPRYNLGTESQAFPLTESFGYLDGEYTAAVRQYGPPEGRDGHFVVFDVDEARHDALRFLAMAASGLTPQIGD